MFKRESLKRTIFHLLIISAIIGVGVSYSKLYLFHLVIPVYCLIAVRRSDFSIFSNPLKLNLNNFLLFNLLWFLICFLWADNIAYAINHFVILFLGTLIMFLIISNVKSEEGLQTLLRIIFYTVCVEIGVALLEMLGVVRWPISSLSFYNPYFGRTNIIQNMIIDTTTLDYLKTVPTGFHWNSNDFAVLLTLTYPFVILSNKKIISYLFPLLITVLIVGASARIAFLVLLLMLIILFVFSPRNKKMILTMNLVFIFACATNFFTFSLSSNRKINEIQNFSRVLLGFEPLEKAEGESSEGVRKQLMQEGFRMIKGTKGIGVGGGNARHHLEKIGGVGKTKITSLHNYWLELMVEGGVIIGIVFGIWYLFMGINLFKIMKEQMSRGNLIPLACLTALVGFVLSAIAPSSCIYFLPMYVFFGICLSIISLYKKPDANLNTI
jgi:teichuronic acid biosynthesis protein TuaE